MNFRCERSHDLLRRHAQQKIHGLLGQILVAEKAREGGQENQKREHRKKCPEGDVSCQRNGFIGKEAADCLIAEGHDGWLVVAHGLRHSRYVHPHSR